MRNLPPPGLLGAVHTLSHPLIHSLDLSREARYLYGVSGFPGVNVVRLPPPIHHL